MSNQYFSKDLSQWEVSKGTGKNKGMDVLKYKDTENFKNNLPEGISLGTLKKSLQYVKDFKIQGVQAAGEAQKDYLKKNKSAEAVVAEFQSGLNTTDVIKVTAIREKEVKIPGTNDKKKVSVVKVKVSSHSHMVPKSVGKGVAKMLADELL